MRAPLFCTMPAALWKRTVLARSYNVKAEAISANAAGCSDF